MIGKDLFGDDNSIVDADATKVDADESYDHPLHHTVLGADGIAGTIDYVIDSNGTPADDSDDIWLTGKLDDFWLASLEPVFNDNGTGVTSDDFYEWPHITDLWGSHIS